MPTASSPGRCSAPTTSTSGPRPLSDEEADFLTNHVATRPGPTYADLEHARAVVLVGFEPEDESPIVFLRLRKAVRTHGLRVYSVASHSSQRAHQAGWPAAADHPGRGGEGHRGRSPPTRTSPSTRAASILVGERMATLTGRLHRGRHAGRLDRCPAGLGAAPGR